MGYPAAIVVGLGVLIGAWWIFGKVYDYTMTEDEEKKD